LLYFIKIGGDTLVVGVLVELANKSVDRIFDYNVDDSIKDDIKVGIRVEVPFGRQTLEGFVLEIKNSSEVKDLKSVIRIIDKDIILNKELIDLGKKIKANTLSTLISCYQAMLPRALKAKKKTNITKKYDIYYDELIFTDAYNKQSKADICIQNNIDIMIDDSISMCTNCIAKGIKTFLMNTKYNERVDIPRVHNWKEIYEVITNEEKSNS